MEPTATTENYENDDDEFDRVGNKGNENATFVADGAAEGIYKFTTMCMTPLSDTELDNNDNPGHALCGNDDDNDDNNEDENNPCFPLKATIPPVRIQNVDKGDTIDGNGKLSRNHEQIDINEEKGKASEDGRYFEMTKPGPNQLKSTQGINNDLISVNFGDFPNHHHENIEENLYQNSNKKYKNNDNNGAGDDLQISTSSTSVPFGQALNYRRQMQCPVAMTQEQQGDADIEDRDNVQSKLGKEGINSFCEKDETEPCPLKSEVSTATVAVSEPLREDVTLEILNDESTKSDPIDSATKKHVNFQEDPKHEIFTAVEAEVSVHATQHSQEVLKSSKIRENDVHASSSSPSSKGSGMPAFNLGVVLPFSDQTRLINTDTIFDKAFEDFNLVDPNDEDGNDSKEERSGKKQPNIIRRTDSDFQKALINIADPSDILVEDFTDKPRRKSVAESAQDWLVEWVERKGKPEWMSPLTVRRKIYRQKVLTQKTVKASGFVILKNTKRKRVQQLQNWWDNVTYTLALWGKSIRRIEGVHGSGVASYFLFLRWLFGLNIVLFAFMLCFTSIPMALMDEDALEPSADTTINTSYYCSEAYVVEKGSGVVSVLEFIQGTGWMEKTYLFYGYYVHALQGTYNLPLAYMLTVLACLIISLVLMARYTGKSFREALLNAANTNFEYSNKVFGAWDYSLTDLKAAEQKQKGIHDDIQGDMLEQTFMRKRIERLEQRCSRCKLYTVRLIINFFILVFLGAAAYLIYFVTSWSTEYAEEHKDATGTNAWLLLLVQYLPSLTITLCNVILPLMFEKVVILEDYSQAFVIQITLIRTVFLRLASLIVLVISLYSEISCTPKDSCNANTGSDCTELKCWETYVGQQFYKLAIMDFLVVIIKVFLVELPRRFAVSKFNCGLFKALGPPEFNIPANVLDLVYGQCLVWLGFLFCPLLPGLNVAKLFIFFFVKKLSALVACPPTDRPYKASRINIFFMIILLVAFSLCALPVMYSVFAIEPSKGCGPFLLFSSMHQALENAVDTWPSALNITYDFLTSAAVTTIVIIFLAVAVYYLRSIGKAHKQQAALYREQLIMEGRDKQFLMSKLQEMYMPGQRAQQEQPQKDQKKNKKKDKDNVEMVDERGHYPSNDPPPNPYSPPNAPVDNGDW